MQKSVSLEKINTVAVTSNAIQAPKSSKPRRKPKSQVSSILERYHITIKPKLHRSSSLSDLATNTSDFTLDYFNQSGKLISEVNKQRTFYESSGDTIDNSIKQTPYMSWKYTGKKSKKKKEMCSETYAAKIAAEFLDKYRQEPNTSSGADSSSACSVRGAGGHTASFPFKSTPSGNLKVQSNQVVFQSSTVGVLLADPTQAKVKVKFEGKAAGEPDDESEQNIDENYSDLQYGQKDTMNVHVKNKIHSDRINKCKIKQEKEKDLASLGYGGGQPIDWMRVQLPKKQDLFQEFYRIVHNYINTDTVIHIGRQEFHCHHLVLQIYSSYFEVNNLREIELPQTKVSPEAFHTIYEWMINNGPESNKLLKRDNVLDIFCAAQYLAIKDLEDQCWSLIVNENLFIEDTAFALFVEARRKELVQIMELMVPRVMRFFLPLVASKDFLQLEAEEVLPFLKSNYICVTSEIEVLMAGVRWLQADWAGRRHLTVDIMRCVRFGLISPWQLVDIKRNPDNAEILEIVNEPQIQQMVDDGLAYVIIKYWYGNNSKNYYHWIDVLGLCEPVERNWIGEEKNHVTYKDFLKYLEQFAAPKDQMYQQMAMMQPPRRNDDIPGNLRGRDNDKMEMPRPKLDFPLPATIKGLTNGKDQFPTMSEFFENRRKEGYPYHSPNRSSLATDTQGHSTLCAKKSPEKILQENKQAETGQIYEPPEKDSTEEINTTNSDTSSGAAGTSATSNHPERQHKRNSVAATFLAAATASLAGTRRDNGIIPSSRIQDSSATLEATTSGTAAVSQNKLSPKISMFNQSKEILAKLQMNKLSVSILGPSNKNYIAEGSLFDWEKETVLVFGGIDLHSPYGVEQNTGKDIYRFDPVTNTWDSVGDLPEPRHHHSVAFFRGRVYLVGGADPRDDDLYGKSVVVSTVWSFEPVSRAWHSETGLTVPRKNFGLVVHRMALYAIGGQDKKGRVLRSVERFEPRTSSWGKVRSMRIARMAAAAAKYRQYLWVAGGMSGDRRRPLLHNVECYDCDTDQWTEINSLRFPRCFATLFAMNDKLYIIGGAGKVTEKDKTPSSVGAIDVWDWKSREWSLETEMAIPRHGHALAYLGTQLIIIGGVTTIYMHALNNVESFCCERGAWIRGVAALPVPLSGHAAVTLPPASLM